MSLRFKGGDWEPMLLGIEPRTCRVCGKGLYRNVTLLRGGWSRCSICNEFVHYSCLAGGRAKFLKQRPRVCQFCRAESQEADGVKEHTGSGSKPEGGEPLKSTRGAGS